MILNLGKFSSRGAATGDRVTSRRLWFDGIPRQIAFLHTMIQVYRERPWAHELAVNIIRNRCAEKDRLCHAIAIAEAVQDRVYYVNENPERFQTPPRTWRARFGDCDDFTTLIGTLLEAIGIKTEVVGLKLNGTWRHVFPRALVNKNGKIHRIPLDATLQTPVGRLPNPIRMALEQGYKVESLTIPPK